MSGGPRSRLLLVGLCGALAGCGDRAESGQVPEHTSGSTVVLTPRALAVTGVQTEPAALTTVPESFSTTGEIEFDPSRVVAVNAPVSGRVRRLSAAVGDPIAAGDTLATIESPEFLAGVGVAIAPRAGVVTSVASALQQFLTAGSELLRIAAVDRVWLRVDLYGEHARLARVGVPVEARVAAFPERAWRGRIAAVAPSVEGATQAVAVRVTLENPDSRLLPGMFATVQVETGARVSGILVPRTAVIGQGGRRLVMIAQDSTFFPSVVVLGPVVGDRVVVLRGINPGERVVVKGAYEIYSAGYAFTRGAEGADDR